MRVTSFKFSELATSFELQVTSFKFSELATSFELRVTSFKFSELATSFELRVTSFKFSELATSFDLLAASFGLPAQFSFVFILHLIMPIILISLIIVQTKFCRLSNEKHLPGLVPGPPDY